MLSQITHTQTRATMPAIMPTAAALAGVCALTNSDTAEVLTFLAVRPVHTVVMTSFINDNGIESDLNRGKFFGFRNYKGELEGIALIGHSTLVETRTEAALIGLALKARYSETNIHLVMSSGDAAERFWSYATDGAAPRLTCREALFETAFPFAVPAKVEGLRMADPSEVLPIAEAQAEVAFIESGVDPMARDSEGFLKRVARRIEQGRIYVVFDGDELVFKTDVIAETAECAYLEGVYVSEKLRGKGIGPRCLANVTLDLLERVSNVCLLSNVEFESAHRSFAKAGFKRTDECVTLFV
jgi:GNAT superfamily N-acetyltransferase